MTFLLSVSVFCLGLYLLSKALNVFYIAWVCIGVYFLSMTAPYPLDTNPFFYVICSFWSFLIITLIFMKEKSKLVGAIISIELCAILVNFISLDDGLTAKTYNAILDTLSMLELLILLYWIPWNGIYNGILSVFGINTYRIANNFSFSSLKDDYKINSIEEEKC